MTIFAIIAAALLTYLLGLRPAYKIIRPDYPYEWADVWLWPCVAAWWLCVDLPVSLAVAAKRALVRYMTM